MLTKEAALALAAAFHGTARYEVSLGWIVTWETHLGTTVVLDDTGLGEYDSPQEVEGGVPRSVIAFSD